MPLSSGYRPDHPAAMNVELGDVLPTPPSMG
jgi:hypothetical protein